MIWGAILAAIPALINAGKGLVDSHRGKKMAQENVRPTLNESGEYEDLLQFYQKQAMYGLDPSSMAWHLQQQNAGLTSSLSALFKSGGDPNMAAALYSLYGNDIGKITTMDSDARWNKVNVVGAAMQQLINAKQTEFLYNKDAPYKDKAQLSAALQNSGNQQTLSSADSLFGNFAKMMNQNYILNKLTEGKGGTGTLNPEAVTVGEGTPNTGDTGTSSATEALKTQMLLKMLTGEDSNIWNMNNPNVA